MSSISASRTVPLTASSGRGVLAALTFVYVFAVGLPWPPFPIQIGLDPSWIYAINAAAASGMRYGHDVLFTYGPLGYLMWPADVAANASRAFAFGAAVAAATAGLAALGVRRAGDNFGALVFAFGIAATLGLAAALRPLAGAPQDTTILLPVALSLWLAWRVDRPWPLVCLAVVVSATAVLIKVSLAAACAAALAIYFAVELARRRVSPWQPALCAVVYAAVVVVLFAATGNRVRDLLPYLTHSLQIAAAYTEGMSLSGAPRDLLLAASALLLFVAVLANTVSDRAELRGPALFLAILIALAFKHGFTRQDPPHMAGFWLDVIAFLSMLALLATGRRQRVLITAGIFLALVNVLRLVPSAPQPAFNPISCIARAASWLRSDWRPAGSAVSRQQLARQHLPAAVADEMRRGSVDVVPWDVTYAPANDLVWNPRPVFQSYAVLHPAIDALNAAHFADRAQAPDFVLYQFKSIDGRHPFFDEPAALRALFCNYAVAAHLPTQLILRRSAVHCGGWEAATAERPLAWNEAMALPDDQDGLHAFFDVRYSWWGLLRRAAVRAPEVTVLVAGADGSEESYRFVPALARDGLWIGHLPRDLAGVAGLLSGDPPAPRRSIRLQTDSPASFRASVGVRFARLAASFAPHP